MFVLIYFRQLWRGADRQDEGEPGQVTTELEEGQVEVEQVEEEASRPTKNKQPKLSLLFEAFGLRLTDRGNEQIESAFRIAVKNMREAINHKDRVIFSLMTEDAQAEILRNLNCQQIVSKAFLHCPYKPYYDQIYSN
jgi:hypothetical protein